MSCAAVVVAAGSGRRMGFDKLLAPLAGKPVLQWSLEAFAAAGEIDEIIVVTPEERLAQLTLPSSKPVTRVDGDRERAFSVMRGLDAVASSSHVAVHDGARPLIDPGQIDNVVRAAHTHRAAVLARKVTETMKRADDADEFTASDVSRDGLWIMETPQAFALDLLRQAYTEAEAQGLVVTDEVSAAGVLNVPTKLVENPTPNLKITVPQDLAVAEAILNSNRS